MSCVLLPCAQSCARSVPVSVSGKCVSASKQKWPLEYLGVDHASPYSVVRGMFSRRSTHKICLEYRLSSSRLKRLTSGRTPVLAGDPIVTQIVLSSDLHLSSSYQALCGRSSLDRKIWVTTRTPASTGACPDVRRFNPLEPVCTPGGFFIVVPTVRPRACVFVCSILKDRCTLLHTSSSIACEFNSKISLISITRVCILIPFDQELWVSLKMIILIPLGSRAWSLV